jgi:hypothetical protein
MRKEELDVLAYVTITPQGTPIRGNTTTQFHPLLRSIRVLGWMSYEEKLTKSNLLHLMMIT